MTWAMIDDQQLGSREPLDDEHDDGGQLPHVREIDRSHEQLRPLLSRRGVEVRSYVAQRFNSILRFDEHMLLTLHIQAEPTAQAPTLYLHREQDDGMFDRFAEHFQRIWEQAQPIEPEPDDHLTLELDPEPDSAPTPEQAQQALDRLRAHRHL